MTRLSLVAFAVLAGLASQAQTPSPAPPAAAPQAPSPARAAGVAPAGNAEVGRKLFVSDGCYQCHGYEAQGSNATGPRLGPRPIAFAAFSRYVRQPTGQMPPYTMKVLSESDLASIYAFVQSRPEAPKEIPLLKP